MTLREQICNVSSTYPDPDVTRATQIYEEAFRKIFEYLYACRIFGAVAEFGTYMGFTARIQASLIKGFAENQLDYPEHPPCHLYLYDSFEGFPESSSEIDRQSYEIKVTKQWIQGNVRAPENAAELIRERLLEIVPAERLTIVRGFYKDTLPQHPIPEKIALLHLDCDLYDSTKMVLDAMLAGDNFQDGCVVMCDDYNCNRANPSQGQRRALRDTFGGAGSPYAYSDFFSYGWHGRAFFLHEMP